jgi:RNA polymerase sigma factor for flagellar operon FliA
MNSGTKIYRQTARNVDRERLILDHLDFVGKVLSTMKIAVKNQDERDNLESAGVVGLIESANNFDNSMETSFQTFAFSRIRGAMIDELRKLAPVSQQMLQKIGSIKKAYQQLEPPVSPERLAEKTELSLSQVQAALEAMRFLTPEDWNDFSSVIHSSWKSSAQSPAHAMELEEKKQLLANSIESLPENERLVLTLYYKEELKLNEIGAVLSLSESRVSRILASAKFRLKELVAAGS